MNFMKSLKCLALVTIHQDKSSSKPGRSSYRGILKCQRWQVGKCTEGDSYLAVGILYLERDVDALHLSCVFLMLSHMASLT